MGEARNRGTPDERRAAAIARRADILLAQRQADAIRHATRQHAMRAAQAKRDRENDEQLYDGPRPQTVVVSGSDMPNEGTRREIEAAAAKAGVNVVFDAPRDVPTPYRSGYARTVLPSVAVAAAIAMMGTGPRTIVREREDPPAPTPTRRRE